jgi:DNA-directed RNA polymerase subunit omega
MKLVDGFDSEYRYVLVAARRARQLQNGARPVVSTQSRKACRIAEEEIKAGMVKWEVSNPNKTPAEAAGETSPGAVGGEADD